MKKRISIKKGLTLWYASFIVIIVVGIMIIMFYISTDIVTTDAKKQLMKIVEKNINDVEYDKDKDNVKFDDDFDFYKKLVYVSVYDDEGILIETQAPATLLIDASFYDGEVRKIDDYYVFDRLIELKSDHKVWLRGIMEASGTVNVMEPIMKIAFITLPFIAIIAIWVGYLITKKGFYPIEKIIKKVDSISEGSDLSRRIELREGYDEIYRLADTFDKMFGRLEDSFKSEKRFTSDSSHELRTPVAVILSECEYVMSSAVTKEEYLESIEVIERQSKKMSKIISQLLDFTRLEQGTEKVFFEEVNLSEIVEMICEEQEKIAINNITIIRYIEENVIAKVDISLIMRLMQNLISNAYKYGKENGYIKVILKKENDKTVFIVHDNGIGIKKDELEYIWKRFYQVNEERSHNEEGSLGLGLAMVRQIAILHGGIVEVESEYGKYSKFIFTF